MKTNALRNMATAAVRRGKHNFSAQYRRHRNVVRTLIVFLGVAAITCTIEFTTKATDPEGISFTLVGGRRATLPAFDVKRKEKGIDWRIDLETDQRIDVATQLVTFQPGGFSGWHTHPGPVFFTVTTGTLTVYEGDDQQCTPLVFPAGTGALEAGTGEHIHMVRNETGSVAEAVVTYLVPVGANPLRTDLPAPDPNNCSF